MNETEINELRPRFRGELIVPGDSSVRFQRDAVLCERLSALGSLSTVIAHEVRNSLMIIKGSLRGLRDESLRQEDAREAANHIDREVARLHRIVGDVLDFAKPLKIETAPTDLGGLCREAVAALAGSDAVVFDLAIDASMEPVVTDEERLRTVIVNLVTNARDSLEARRALAGASSGSGALRAEIGCRRLPSGRALLWVEDHGVGIAASHLSHIFEPYFTSKRTGTGLGLAIVGKIVHALGAVIRVESREGEGTRFEIELSATGSGSWAMEARSAPGRVSAQSSGVFRTSGHDVGHSGAGNPVTPTVTPREVQTHGSYA